MAARVGEPGDRSRNVDYVVPAEPIDVVDLPEITVSDVEIGEQSVHFHVDRIGVPVLVRVSYFPNWQAHGAEGPYRVAPNFMVVVPTSNDVSLTYERSSLDWFFYALTLCGIALCFYWRRRGDMIYPDAIHVDARPADEQPVGELVDPLVDPPVDEPVEPLVSAPVDGPLG